MPYADATFVSKKTYGYDHNFFQKTFYDIGHFYAYGVYNGINCS